MKCIFYLFSFFVLFPGISTAQSPRLKAILPDHANLQFAGGIGFLSAGVGWETNHKRIQAGLSYGYVPESVGGVEIHSITGKFNWAAVSKQLDQDVRADFLTVGVLVNYVFGSQYFLFDPENYPYDYYKFPTAAHVGVYLGGAVYYGKFGAYYELGTTDRSVLSWVQNMNSVKIDNLLNLAIGVRYSLFGHDWQHRRKGD